MANKWKSTEKDIVNSFRATHNKIENLPHLPKVAKQQTNDSEII